MGLFLSLFHPSDMFQKSVRCYLIMGAFLIWVPYGGFLWERFLLVGSFGKGVFWKRVLWKGNLTPALTFLELSVPLFITYRQTGFMILRTRSQKYRRLYDGCLIQENTMGHICTT